MVPTYEAGRDTKATEENIISLAGRGTARGKCHRLRRKALQSRSDCRIWPLGAGRSPGGLRSFARSDKKEGSLHALRDSVVNPRAITKKSWALLSAQLSHDY